MVYDVQVLLQCQLYITKVVSFLASRKLRAVVIIEKHVVRCLIA